MGSLNWTTESQRWLKDIYEFVAINDPVAVKRVVSGIFDRAQVLTEHPKIGYLYQSSSRHVSVLMYGHYRIAYLVKVGGDIDVLGVFHGSLDISRYSL